MSAYAEVIRERLLECFGQSALDAELEKAVFISAVNWGKLPHAGGSPLFSVELELGQAKLAGGEVKHGDEVGGGAVAPGFAFGGAEDTV